jgi:hypothetical protein
MRRVALATAAIALVFAAPATAEVVMPSSFTGSCQVSGPIAPMPPITVVPVPGPHFSYSGTGTCTGTLDGDPATAAPLSLTFANVSTLFDTCELGPDFNLPGALTIGPSGKRARFAITVNLARLAVAGPFLLTTEGRGLAYGVAQFSPSNNSTAAQQCATTGIAAATLSASFTTASPLVGERDQPPQPPPGTAHVQPPQPSVVSSACSASRSRRIVLPLVHGRRIVSVAVYVDRHLVVRRKARDLRVVRLPALTPGRHAIRIVARLAGRGRRVVSRRYGVCA